MIGVDLVCVSEFRRQLEIGGDAFLRRAFDDAELADGDAERLAGLWAAKEAVIKASSRPLASPRDVVISHAQSGRPLATTATGSFHVSIAHHGDYAVAVAMEAAS